MRPDGLEAMAHDVPVVASRATSFPEVYGAAARYFDPTGPIDLAGVLADVLDSPARRAQMAAAGREQASRYSWSSMADVTLAAYAKVLRQP
jgi:glycosyltransferase involved in cell wall biosynthesis